MVRLAQWSHVAGCACKIGLEPLTRLLLADAQTSGGLLASCPGEPIQNWAVGRVIEGVPGRNAVA